jgi:two-component system nitrogen regulation sensor histidine kinase GlnL
MNFYAVSALINGIISTILGVFVVTRNRKDIRYITYSLFCLSISVWSYFYFAWQITSDKGMALFCSRGLMAGAIFIPISYLHHLLVLFDIYNQKKKIIFYGYVAGLVFFVLNLTPIFIKDVSPKLIFKFWPEPGIIYHLFFILWLGYVIYGISIIFSEYKKSAGSRKNQLRYVLLATFIGWGGGVTNYFLWYNIPVFPFGNIFVSGYVLIIAYAILRYHLMDIRVAITRSGIFIAVYTFVLGIPFALAGWCKDWLLSKIGANWWIVPLTIMAVLATAAPFIYLYLNRKAEERLLREQKRYQNTLKYASIGMTRIRKVKKLLRFMAHVTARVVRLKYACIYLIDNENSRYKIEAVRSTGRLAAVLPQIEASSPLVKWLLEQREPLVMGEIKGGMQDMPQKELEQLNNQLALMNAALVVPSFAGSKLLGFMILGDKLSGEIYTQDDLHVFTVLANQAALAIENAMFIEESKEMEEQIAQAEKMATIGTMAEGISHQMNNRFHALSLIVGDTLDTIKLADTAGYSVQQKELLNQIKHGLERVQSNILQGSELVKGMLKYSLKGESGFSAVALDKIIDATLEMVQYKIKLNNIDIIREYPKDMSTIYGNLTQLLEVFFNLIDNAYDAAMERQDALKEEGYRPRIRIYTEGANNGYLKIHIEDNGMGVRPENLRRMFTPFFTTKASSRKGTGLGLYVIQKIITVNHSGKIYVASHYAQGTTFTLELPAANASPRENLFQGAL